MKVVVNEMELISPAPTPEVAPNIEPPKVETPGPTPHDIYWVTRQLTERRLRLQAR